MSFLVAVCLPPRMSQKPIFYTGCVFHADILDRVCFSYQYFRQGSIFVLRKILDRVEFEHQVGTYFYENDRSTPTPGVASTCLRSFRLYVRVCTEKMMDHQYRENGARNVYSNHNQMRAYAECSLDQSKKLYLIDLSIEQSTKVGGFRNSAGCFCISILPEYCSSALTAQAYKMVITTVCVQINNCFCNTQIFVH